MLVVIRLCAILFVTGVIKVDKVKRRMCEGVIYLVLRKGKEKKCEKRMYS